MGASKHSTQAKHRETPLLAGAKVSVKGKHAAK